MTPIACTVGGDLILHNLPARPTERLRYALSYPNQKYHFAKRRGWSTGTEQETIELIVEMPNGDVHIPRGAVRIVKQELMKDGYVLKVAQDLRKPGTHLSAFSPIALRDYQEAGVDALTKNVQGIVVLPCGGGKTRMAVATIARLALSTLIVVPSLDLADQWCADIQTHLQITPGKLGGGKKDLAHPVVVAVEDSLVSWIANNADMTWIESFGFLVVDECFPAGTLIDETPIDKINIGDYVSSFSLEGVVSKKQVKRLFKKTPSSLMRIRTEDGSTVICTPNHKIWTRNGWIEALFCKGEEVFLHGKEEARNQLSCLPISSRTDWTKTDRSRSGRARPLFDEVCSGVEATAQLRNDGEYQSSPRIRTHDTAQPDATRRDSPEGVCDTSRDGVEAQSPGRQRSRDDRTSGTSGQCVAMDLRRGCGVYQDAERFRISNQLQNRSGRQDSEDRNRDRWGITPIFCDPREGSEERNIPSWSRVDHLEVFQPGSDGKFGGLCPDGFVYNIEVADNHTYFANGIGVSNCHHVPSKSLTHIVRSVPAKYRLGLTATPYREDRADDAIPWNFGSVLLTRTTKELIDAGYLMSAEIDLVATGWSFSYTGPETKRQTRMEAALVADLSRNALIADRAVADAQRGESVLILTGRKSHTKELESILQQRGVAAVAVTSETARGKRKRTLADLRSGELHVMIATQLADEGLDIPRLSRVHLAFPQKARGATVQRLGRLLRKYEKWPRLIDYIDEQVPALVKRAQQRRKVYRDTGLLRE